MYVKGQAVGRGALAILALRMSYFRLIWTWLPHKNFQHGSAVSNEYAQYVTTYGHPKNRSAEPSVTKFAFRPKIHYIPRALILVLN
jgi:hypothetical protein